MRCFWSKLSRNGNRMDVNNTCPQNILNWQMLTCNSKDLSFIIKIIRWFIYCISFSVANKDAGIHSKVASRNVISKTDKAITLESTGKKKKKKGKIHLSSNVWKANIHGWNKHRACYNQKNTMYISLVMGFFGDSCISFWNVLSEVMRTNICLPSR